MPGVTVPSAPTAVSDLLESPGVRLNELVRGLAADKFQISLVVTHLGSEGLVEKRSDFRDQRLVRIRPADPGRSELNGWQPVPVGPVGPLLAPLSAE